MFNFMFRAVVLTLGLSTCFTTWTVLAQTLPLPSSNRGLLVTFPKSLYIGTTEKVCFTTKGLVGEATVLLTIQPDDQCGGPRERTHWTGNETDACLEFSVVCPTRSGGNVARRITADLLMSVRGMTSEEQPIVKRYEKTLTMVAETKKTFIQTDKPMYQPGQKVMFRVLTVKYPDMTPDVGNVNDVWISSPTGTRMQQWRSLVSSEGLLDLDFQLSSEPVMGSWQIHVLVHGEGEEIQAFDVKEYVLPKFEVRIAPPAYIYMGEQGGINIEICAMYTYGQPVRGRISANITANNPDERPRHWRPVILRPVLHAERDADDTGCANISIPDLSLDARGYSYHNQKLVVTANFIERGTGVSMTATSSSTPIETEPVKMKLEVPDSFRPGLPYKGQVTVTYPDGSPAPEHQVNISFNHVDPAILVTTVEGVGKFELATPFDPTVSSVSLSAIFAGESMASYLEARDEARTLRKYYISPRNAYKSVWAWYSPSASFLDIRPINKAVADHESIPVQLDFTVPLSERTAAIEFYYRIVSRGKILSNGQHSWSNPNVTNSVGGVAVEVRSGPGEEAARSTRAIRKRRQENLGYYGGSQTTAPELNPYPSVGTGTLHFTFNATVKMSPVSRLLVYYIRDDGEVVSASTEFKMAPVFENQVSVEFLEGREVRPGHPASISVSAQASSLCAVGVVDKSVHIMSGSNQLTKAKVFSPVNILSEIQGSKSTDCPTGTPTESTTVRVRASSRHADGVEGFRMAGLDVLTGLELETRPCWVTSTPQCRGWHCHMRRFQFGDIAFVMDSERGESIPMEEEELAGPLVELRNYFPETWLWKLMRIGLTGQTVTTEDIPHTITDWVASAFCLSADQGVGVAESTSIRAFQPFFLSYTLPYSVMRGEKVPVKVTIFNYLGSCLNIQFAMTESSNYSIEVRPESETIVVCGNGTETVEYEVVFIELGDIPIRVTASADVPAERGDIPIDRSVFPVTDAIEDTILIEPEGAEREETFSELVCPNDEEDGLYSNTVPLALPSQIVPGSARGRIQVIGDLMGSVMSNLDSLLRMPYGCGEQNMITMAPSIYVMQYLSHTHQLTSAIQEKALGFMQSGYQRELTYQLSDGSYSAFGESDGQGSTWLTAFVLKCFAQAQSFMDIDEADLDRTRHWLARNSRDENGCVIKQGRVIHKEMQGSVSSPVTMTAFVTIALIEGGASTLDVEVIHGLECMKNWLETTESDHMDTYSLAITSYALGLGRYYATQTDAISKLDEKRRGDAHLYYWGNTDVTESEDTVCVSHCHADSSTVEITAYTLLGKLHQDQDFSAILSQTMPIVRWLNTQRNALGGFSSTQDTVVGLQALSHFAGLIYDPESNMTLDIAVEATRENPNPNQEYAFEVRNTNRLLLQREDLTEVPTDLFITASGTGCALFQAELRYNVPVISPTQPLFDFRVTVRDWQSNAIADPAVCGDKTVEICVRYTGSEDETNMAVIEVKMVSGYIPHQESLEEFHSREGGLIGLKRIDKYEKGKPLALYFDQFDDIVRCVPINMKQEFVVKEAKDAVIKVYDYYKPGVVGFKSYQTCDNPNSEI